jgi:hypothetical protein
MPWEDLLDVFIDPLLHYADRRGCLTWILIVLEAGLAVASLFFGWPTPGLWLVMIGVVMTATGGWMLYRSK